MFCQSECRIESAVKKKALELNVNYITCQICQRAVFNVVGAHLRKYHPEYTTDRYHAEFPGHPVFADHTMEQVRAGSIKAGARMREPEKREHFRNLMTGEKNPMHRNNASEEKRKSISPFSADFYLKRNPDLTLEEAQILTQTKNKKAMEGRLSWTQAEYWLRKGMTEEEAKLQISKLQVTFSLEICIEKHGEEEGRRIWNERQSKWKSKVYNDQTYLGGGTSMVGQDLIELLLLELKERNYSGEILYGKNEKFIRTGNHAFKYDFTLKDERKIIEFNGDFWHCNPKIFQSDFYNKPKKMTAQQIWDYDPEKEIAAREQGYDLLYIWESDFRKERQATIDRCVEFIYAENQGHPQKVHSPTDQ